MAEGTAWKVDSEGYYVEMLQGEKKDFSMNWADELGTDTIQGAVLWTLDANVTKVSQAEASPVGQVRLHASGVAGTYECSAKMTSTGGLVDIVPFRVVIA